MAETCLEKIHKAMERQALQRHGGADGITMEDLRNLVNEIPPYVLKLNELDDLPQVLTKIKRSGLACITYSVWILFFGLS